MEHHIGKSYSILKNVEEAKKHLNEAIKLNPYSFSSMQSLARLYNNKEEREQISAMVDRIMAPKTIDRVPVSVLLSVYGLIATSKNDALRKKYVDDDLGRFYEVIESSLSKEYSHTYLVLSMLSGGLSFRYPDYYNRLCARLPMPLSKDKNSQQRKNYGKILANQYRYAMKDGEARKDVYERVLKCLEGNPDDNDYDRKALMDFYIAAGEPDKAIYLAEQFENKEDIYRYQSLCKAYRVKTDYGTALAMIDKSIAGENEKTFAGHKAAFRHDKALCLLALNRREEAVAIQKEAIALQTDSKSKAEWEEELSSMVKRTI